LEETRVPGWIPHQKNGNMKKRGTDQWTVRSMFEPPIRRRSGWGEMFFMPENTGFSLELQGFAGSKVFIFYADF
ncbi:MAG: hypothetical protein IJ386_00180, partial [Clostridia bacterium]|nr:hypothetical protein [Clostridia bacterium]